MEQNNQPQPNQVQNPQDEEITKEELKLLREKAKKFDDLEKQVQDDKKHAKLVEEVTQEVVKQTPVEVEPDEYECGNCGATVDKSMEKCPSCFANLEWE